ncbi:DUF226 domain-containing protein [Borreliella valaisiana]|uniref:DUF226 domain-containing protein n=1 Tax=Borreliella valaisiana TaxID=62088 RepID=UPI003B218C04
MQSLRTLLRKKDKESTKYYRLNLEHIKRMENTEYEFYSKKYIINTIFLYIKRFR